MARMNWSAQRARCLVHTRPYDPLQEHRTPYAQMRSASREGPQQSASEPVQVAALREPVYDDVTGRTYQLVTRLSDDVPHTLSCAGNHADALVDTLNTRRALAHERNTLRKSMSSTARPKLSEAERAAANVRMSEIADAMKSLRAAELDRTDRIARMLRLYAEAESEAGN